MADYTIDGIELKAGYGVTVLKGSGFLDFLPRKGETGHSWPDENGLEPYADAADLVYEARTITLECILQGATKAVFLAKRAAFRAALDAPGLRTLVNPHTGTTHQVCRVEGSAADLLTKWNPSKNAMRFTLKLQEPEPTL